MTEERKTEDTYTHIYKHTHIHTHVHMNFRDPAEISPDNGLNAKCSEGILTWSC